MFPVLCRLGRCTQVTPRGLSDGRPGYHYSYRGAVAMRCIYSLAAIASFLVLNWIAPLRAEDDSARQAKILDQVAQTLDQADLPAETKERVLRDLKISLAKAFDDTVEV